ncbi:WD40 repeat domain-containing serine/threonine protein kinase [Herbidospora cretacea]|uniref:WD40 repeat domain-containing serine/threonine protein kinase n=1 Tax=Herbidospora cretacea TaxID=28444 RepID=UPI000773B9D7|nr:serine/threonine-protein kinase [Herbidospora cretacea]
MPDVHPLRSGDPERIGAYRLVGVLGAGGQGVVYQGLDEAGHQVAVKLLHPHLSHDKNATKSFLREVEAARRVAAFCTAAVLDVGLLDQQPYIVSEYIAGDTLQALVRSAGPRTGGALDRLAISTLTALAAIHEAGIVHRDFKPGNVLVGPEGPIVIDFGIAKALDSTTLASGPIGTPAYMSPEQFRGDRVTPASDIFSWAGTMVFAATGRQPFAGQTVPALVNAVLSERPDLSGMPAHLLDPIAACFAKDPAARPSAADLLRHLIRPAGPAPSPARSEPARVPVNDADTHPHQTRKMSRRVLIGGAAAAGAAAISALAVFRDRDRIPTPNAGEQHRGSSVTASPPPSPSPSPTASAEPFGTEIRGPIPLASGDGDPTAVTAAGAVVACGTSKGITFIWDANTTTLTRLGDRGPAVTSVAIGTHSGTQVVATGHTDGRIRLWSLTGAKLAVLRARDPIVAVFAGHRALAVSQKYDSLRDLHSVVRLTDIATGEQIGGTITDHFQGISGLAFGRIDQDDVLVTGDGAERIRVWNLSTGRLRHSFRTGDVGGIELLACGESDGRPILVSTHLDATLRVHDLVTGKSRKKWSFSDRSPDDRGAAALATGHRGDMPIAVVAHNPLGGRITVRIWNLRDGAVIGELSSAPGGATATVALAELTGRSVVVGATEDRTLHAWSLGRT